MFHRNLQCLDNFDPYLIIKLKHPSQFVFWRGVGSAVCRNDEFIEVNEVILVLIKCRKDKVCHDLAILRRETDREHLHDLVSCQDS